MSTDTNMQSTVILQHVKPQNNEPMESQEKQSKYIPADMPKPLVKFFQGEPEVLGVTQLFIGLNHIFFGFVLTTSCHWAHCFLIHVLINSGVLFWSGIMYVISGSLSIAASYKPSLGKVNASLVLNIISSVAAMVSAVIFSAMFSDISRYGYYHDDGSYCAYDKQRETCGREFLPLTFFKGLGSILFLLTALEFCIALSASIFGCKTACRTSYSDVAVVIYHTTSVNDSKPPSSDEEVKMN